MACSRIIPVLLMSCLVTVLLGGCALTTDQIKLSYDPGSSSRIEGADLIKVRAEVIDLRSIKDKVSVKKNAYGMEMASIVASNNVPELIAESINRELANRGFNIADGNLIIRNELSRFYSDFKVGFWAGDAAADVIMSVQVKKPDGAIVFAKIISGQYVNENIQLASGENARIALNGALKDAIQKLVNDPEFMNCLLKSSHP